MSERMSVDSFVAGCPEPQRAIVSRLRALIREVAPHLDERVKWGKPVYGIGTADLLSIVPHARYVNLQVFNGGTLKDADQLLEGTGKAMRHVKCRAIPDLERPELRQLLMEAVGSSRFPVGSA